MTELMSRNFRLVRAALDKEKIRYFITAQTLIAYMPRKVGLKSRRLSATTIRVTVVPCDAGILFETGLPVALKDLSDAERQLLTRKIAEINYGKIHGGLTYKAESERVNYRVFYALGDNACFDSNEVIACLRLSAAAISDGYEAIVKALDEFRSSDDDAEDTADCSNFKDKLEAMFNRIFSSYCGDSE